MPRPAPGCVLVVTTLGLTLAATALLATAIMTDHWEHVTYDPDQVAAIAHSRNVTDIEWILDGTVARMHIRRDPRAHRVTRSTHVVHLIPLYGGIWQLCTDLQDEHREKLESLEYVYPRCVSYLSASSLVQDEKNDWMTRMQNLAISCAIVCLILLASSAFVGVFGIGKRQISAVLVTGVMYILAVFCVFTLSIMHFKRRSGRECGAIDRQLIPSAFQGAQILAAGWSFGLGWGGVAVCLLASFLWYLLSKIMRYGPLTIV